MSTYKLDEPMSWESFKAMSEDLQKKYILNLQETYQANNDMLGKMFGVTGVSVCRMRNALGIKAMGQSKMTRGEVAVRDAKWDALILKLKSRLRSRRWARSKNLSKNSSKNLLKHPKRRNLSIF